MPVHLPYVVKLHKFYETDNAIYLLLQHATGGKLWSYISGYLQQQNNNDPELDDILNDPHEKKLRERTAVECNGNEHIKPEQPVMHPSSLEMRDESVDIRENGVHFDNKTDKVCEDHFVPSALDGGEDNVSEDNVCDVHGQDKPQTKINNELFGLDDSQDSLSLSSLRLSAQHPFSRSVSQEPETSDGLKPVTPNAVLEQQDKFEELLQGTKCKPSLEQFSINSFDSDSCPGSRYESNTSDYIESIPELSESMDGQTEKDNYNDCHLPDDVFNIQSTSSSDAEVIKSAIQVIDNAKKELNENVLNESDVKRTSTSASTPEDEPSIYDKYKEHDSSDVSSDSETITQNRQRRGDVLKNLPAQKSTPQMTSLPAPASPSRLTGMDSGQSKSASTSPTKSAELQPKQIFRVHSQDRSADGEVKPRKRHLSSMFGSFDLDNDKVTLAKLPEECVKQWAAEIVVALASLHLMGLVCR